MWPAVEAMHDVQQGALLMSHAEVIARIRKMLGDYTFTAVNEEDLQVQVTGILAVDGGDIIPEREVIAQHGRYDILVRCDDVVVVLELKVKGSAAEVERQAQRYALTDGVDAVVVVTTSQRLARQLEDGGKTLGGKPFAVIALRSF